MTLACHMRFVIKMSKQLHKKEAAYQIYAKVIGMSRDHVMIITHKKCIFIEDLSGLHP